MKTILQGLHLIIYTTILLSMLACENEIPYTHTIQAPQLIMNALLNAESNDNLVYLHLSENNKIGRIDNASLSLYVNNQLSESPQPLSQAELTGYQQTYTADNMQELTPSSTKFKAFRLTTILHPGDNIRLEGTAENGKYHVSAEVTVPDPINEVQVDTFPAYLRKYNSLYPYRQYKITIKDRPNEKNYYRLEIINKFSFRCKPINDTYPDTIISMNYTGFIDREDVILTDGHPASSDDEENGLFPTIQNLHSIFTDSRFSNSTATLKVYTDLYEKILPDAVFQQIYRTGSITVRVISITEAEYRYLKALNCLASDDYDNTLMEAVSLPCNVKGGLGFVGAQASSNKTIHFPETAIFHPIYTDDSSNDNILRFAQ